MFDGKNQTQEDEKTAGTRGLSPNQGKIEEKEYLEMEYNGVARS